MNKVFTLKNSVVNNSVVNRMDNSKEKILDIERSGNKLLGFKNVIYFIPKKRHNFTLEEKVF